MEPDINHVSFSKTCNEISLTVHTRAPARAHSPPRNNLADAWANEIIQYEAMVDNLHLLFFNTVSNWIQVYKPLIILSVLRLRGLQADRLLAWLLSPAEPERILCRWKAFSAPFFCVHHNIFMYQGVLRIPQVAMFLITWWLTQAPG